MVDGAWPPGVPVWPARLAEQRLDYLEGIVPPPAYADVLGSCRDVAKPFWLVNRTTGEIAEPRCKATNKCSHCRRLGALETCEMIALDAEEEAPTLYVVLTCREFITRADIRRHLEHCRRGVRKRWPACAWFCALEWQRRGALHINLVVKRVPAPECSSFRSRLLSVWMSRVSAVAEAQYVAPITSARHAAAYVHKLGRYLTKDDQAAPPGWRGHRTSQSRDYLVRPAAELRREARESLAYKAIARRYVWCGVSVVEAAWRAAADVVARRDDEWVLYPAVALCPVRDGPPVLRRGEAISADRDIGVADVHRRGERPGSGDDVASPPRHDVGREDGALPYGEGLAGGPEDSAGGRLNLVAPVHVDVSDYPRLAGRNADRRHVRRLFECEERDAVKSAHWRDDGPARGEGPARWG